MSLQGGVNIEEEQVHWNILNNYWEQEQIFSKVNAV